MERFEIYILYAYVEFMYKTSFRFFLVSQHQKLLMWFD